LPGPKGNERLTTSPCFFHSLVDLCRRYTRFHDRRLRHDSLFDRHVTHWWRRSWEGAIARSCAADVAFEEPPFGIAEWVRFSPVDWHE